MKTIHIEIIKIKLNRNSIIAMGIRYGWLELSGNINLGLWRGELSNS
jgi:hypothetical protein